MSLLQGLQARLDDYIALFISTTLTHSVQGTQDIHLLLDYFAWKQIVVEQSAATQCLKQWSNDRREFAR